jgi:acylphosphatase
LLITGRGSVWLERLVRDQEVDSSNLSAPTKLMKKQVHLYYSGTVQGVGFRYTARQIADDLGVYGWAKNLGDGRVEVVAEAEEDILQDFLSRINQYFSRDIQKTDTQKQLATGGFKDFSIRF